MQDYKSLCIAVMIYGTLVNTQTGGPISLCVDLFVFTCVYFVCFCFILHSCCIIVSTVGWT